VHAIPFQKTFPLNTFTKHWKLLIIASAVKDSDKTWTVVAAQEIWQNK
jgi:hypothetical protein